MATRLLLGALLIAGSAAGAGEPPICWNANAEWFMYAPSFAFKEVAGAAKYRFRVLDDCHVTREFVAAKPFDSLAPVWEKLPKGFVTVTCFALGANGEVVGLAGERTFWKNAPFKEGAYPNATRRLRPVTRRRNAPMRRWKSCTRRFGRCGQAEWRWK